MTISDRKEHFLALLMIGFLASPGGLRNDDGFVPGSLVMSEMMKMGFVENQIRASLRRLAEHRLIETPHAHFREITVEENEIVESYHFRATSVGIYHMRYWCGSFSFLDAMCLDTPVFEESKRAVIINFASSFEIRDRLTKAKAFLSYLESAWFEANFNANYFDFRTAIDSQRKSFEAVQRVVDRQTA